MIPFNNKKELEKIIENYVSGKATAEEIKFVEAYYQYLDKGNNVLDEKSAADLSNMEAYNYQAIQNKITTKKRVIPFYTYAAAAVLFISLAIGSFYINKSEVTTPLKAQLAKKIDVLPGVDKAILTLADGSKIVLDHQTKGNISEHAGVTISKTADGQLIYKVSGKSKNASSTIAYNTIETPKGGQYQVFLPDGTRVWLNAASSLKYPEIFAGNERKVELNGEAYFEVAKNKSLPFKVISKNQEVEVLGTHFNINTYMDEKTIKTTLLEGSIRVSNHKSTKILKPGEQSLIADYGLAAINVMYVDAEDETAWKNGQFRFNNAGLKSILSQLERWYDVKIDYTTVPDKRYNGMVPRNAKLSEVLKMLELTGSINFSIEENRQLKVLQK